MFDLPISYTRLRRWMLAILFISFSFGASAGLNMGTVLVLRADQVPSQFKKVDAHTVYLLYYGASFSNVEQGDFLRGDTIINFSKFKSRFSNITGYRLVFKSAVKTDSVWQTDRNFRITDKAYPVGDDLVRFQQLDNNGMVAEEFTINIRQKMTRMNKDFPASAPTYVLHNRLFKEYEVYKLSDRKDFAVASLWILSIGIDDYGKDKFRTCKSDAVSYSRFFSEQFREKTGQEFPGLVNVYTLTDSLATRDSILGALRDIARRASANDFFIFNFSGVSNKLPQFAEASGTYFFPWEIIIKDNQWEGAVIGNRDTKDTTPAFRNCISLRVLQEHIQVIPAVNQLFISEAGPSDKFRTEFIRTMMQNSLEVARILDKNRVIIVPNGFGYDGVSCEGVTISKGPINYYITSLETGNIFDLFGSESVANQLAYQLRNKAWQCKSFKDEYFDIFFERKFLREYEELLSGNMGGTRGFTPDKKDLKKLANLGGKSYALVVGTNNYSGGGWKRLPNAINDARAVSQVLRDAYGFEVQLLEDAPIDTIYRALTRYYQKLDPDDQFIIYFAGHGDLENEFMDDGFIVCTDSRSREDDPTRNSYIQYVKLQKMVNKIPARQILVMLDVCHGGTFNQKRSDAVRTIENRNVQQFLADQSTYTCRKFLSSVGAEEAFDGKPGDHSPFANLLLQVLGAKGANSNGIVTLSSIYAVLQTASMNETATLKISPQKDGFGKDNPESEFILIPIDVEQGKAN